MHKLTIHLRGTNLSTYRDAEGAGARERLADRDAPLLDRLRLLPEHHLRSIRIRKNNYFTEMCSGSEAGSYLRRIDSCITQLKAQGPSRTCNESKEEKEEDYLRGIRVREVRNLKKRGERLVTLWRRRCLQGYLVHKKPPARRTLQ